MATKVIARPGSGGLRGTIEAQLEALTPRDRMLLTVLAVAFVVPVALFVMYLARDVVGNKASRVQVVEDNADVLEAIAAEYSTENARLTAGLARSKEQVGKPGNAVAEKVAQDVGLQEKLTGVSEAGAETVKGIRQTRYRAEFKRISLKSALDFVGAVETADYPMTVDVARFKTVTDRTGDKEVKLVDFSAELIAYQPEAE